MLSDEFTQDSFPVRYCDNYPDLQNLKTHIEAGSISRVAEGEELGKWGPASLALDHNQCSTRRQLDEGAKADFFFAY